MRRVAAAIVGAATLALGGTAAAQDPGAGSACALTSVEEANAVFAGAGLVENDNSRGYYCAFSGTFDLTLSLMQETTLADYTSRFPDGGVDVTAAGMPAWWQEGSGNLGVAANGSVLMMNGWGSSDDSPTQLALLSTLAERIVPRIPPPADPEVVAGLTALLPAGLEGGVAVLPGWYLAGSLRGTPELQALADLLAAQGLTPDDLVIVQTGSGDRSAVLAEAPGADAGPLLLPLLSAILPPLAAAPVSTVEIGGRQVTRFEMEPPFFAAAAGSRVAFAYGPDDFLATFFATAP